MNSLAATDVLATQKALHRLLLARRGTVRWPEARSLAAQLLLTLDDADGCWQLAAEWLRDAFDVDRVTAGRGDPACPVFLPGQAEAQRPRAGVPSMRVLRIDNADPGVKGLWQSRRPVVFADVPRAACFTPALRGALASVGTTSKMAVTLRTSAGAFGLLCMDRVQRADRWRTVQYERFESAAADVLGPVLWSAESLAGRNNLLLDDATHRPAAAIRQLTPAELQVARLAAQGLSYKQIASQLGRAFSTIDHQLRSVRRKLGVRSHAQLASLLAGQSLPPLPGQDRDSSR